MKKGLGMIVLLMVAGALLFAGGAKETGAAKKIRFGVTIEDFNDVFMRYLLDQLKDEASKVGAEVIAMDGKRDPNEQIKQIENFITQKVDAIIIHVIDQTIAPRITKLCNDAKIPLVYVNRKPEDQALQGEKVVAVASPEEVAGRLEAEFVVNKLNGKGNVAILLGTLGSAPQIGRTKGSKEVIAKYPDMKVIREQAANFQRPEAVAVVENWLASGDKIDAIIANNDEMAIGAVLVLEEKKMKDKVVVTGVDATSDALKFIEEGRLDMTVFQNGGAQGRGAVQAALKMIKGEPVEKFVEIPFEPVTRENYTKYKK
ncbi:MAG TPA: substrate-binding domain-containing protein [Spirochaetales bacterium]|nr:substrate-binding domain-containing protein [Spirochaetales bacterium]HOV38488.1 substrate-binding domain-containing protein [Spirochaetales bacterium]